MYLPPSGMFSPKVSRRRTPFSLSAYTYALLCIWRCEHARFCVEVFMRHTKRFIHSFCFAVTGGLGSCPFLLLAGRKDDVEEHAYAHQPGSDVHHSLPLLGRVLGKTKCQMVPWKLVSYALEALSDSDWSWQRVGGSIWWLGFRPSLLFAVSYLKAGDKTTELSRWRG